MHKFILNTFLHAIYWVATEKMWFIYKLRFIYELKLRFLIKPKFLIKLKLRFEF